LRWHADSRDAEVPVAWLMGILARAEAEVPE
jgi:hypothetical protein